MALACFSVFPFSVRLQCFAEYVQQCLLVQPVREPQFYELLKQPQKNRNILPYKGNMGIIICVFLGVS